MKKIITYGTFDLFHYGHYNLLKRASELGDELYVGISSDDMCLDKGKVTFLDQAKRLEIVSSLSFVTQTFIEHNMHQKVDDCKKYGIDVFVLGGDYRDIFPKMKEYGELIEGGVQVVFFDRTPEISSTDLKKRIILQSKLDEG